MHATTPTSSFQRNTAPDKLLLARECYERGHFRDCIAALRNEVQHGGLLRGQTEAHLLYLQSLIKAGPRGWRHMRSADVQAHFKANHFEAQHHIDGLHERVRSTISFTFLQARLRTAEGRHAEAYDIMEALFKNKADKPKLLRRGDVVLYMARLYGNTDQPAKGIQLITDSIKANPKNGNNALLLMMKADLFVQNGEIARAVKFLESHSDQYGALRFDERAQDMIEHLETLPPQRRPRP